MVISEAVKICISLNLVTVPFRFSERNYWYKRIVTPWILRLNVSNAEEHTYWHPDKHTHHDFDNWHNRNRNRFKWSKQAQMKVQYIQVDAKASQQNPTISPDSPRCPSSASPTLSWAWAPSLLSWSCSQWWWCVFGHASSCWLLRCHRQTPPLPPRRPWTSSDAHDPLEQSRISENRKNSFFHTIDTNLHCDERLRSRRENLEWWLRGHRWQVLQVDWMQQCLKPHCLDSINHWCLLDDAWWTYPYHLLGLQARARVLPLLQLPPLPPPHPPVLELWTLSTWLPRASLTWTQEPTRNIYI